MTQARGDAEAVLQLLIDDHRAMQDLFKRFTEGGLEATARHALAIRACREIEAHQQLEEEVFYAVLMEKLDDTGELEEGLVEHGMIKELAERVAVMSPADVRFNATVTVLGEYLNHHLREEERDLFPQVRGAPVDFANLLQAMQDFRRRLQRERRVPGDARESARS